MDNNKDSNNSQALLRKASRLCVAIYKISDFFEYAEPMRLRLKFNALNLLQATLSYTTTSVREPSQSIKDITDSINSLSAFFDVLMISDIVSEINGKIIKDELLSFIKLVERYFQDRFGYMLALGEFLDKVDNKGLVSANVPKETSISTELTPSLKDDRKLKIVDFIRKNGPSTIRDLTVIVRGCSEKTIQRELLSLVASGFVRRQGERRWSKYLLA